MKFKVFAVAFVFAISALAQDAKRPFTFEDMMKLKRVFTRLFYRHWNAFTEFKRSHLFVVSADANAPNIDFQSVAPAPNAVGTDSHTADKMSAELTGQRPVLQPRDLTPGDHAVPPFHLGGQDMYAISPDCQELAYTSNIDEVEATSTNNEIFIVPRAGPAVAGKKISTSPGSDATPLYSPDGKYIASRSQARAGFEADKWRLFIQDRQSGKTRDLSYKFDRSVGRFCWQKGNVVWLTYEQYGQAFLAQVDATTDSEIHPYPFSPMREMHADELAVMDRTIFYTQSSVKAPNEIWSWVLGTHASATQNPGPITHRNDAVLSQIDMQPLESFSFKGASDEEVQGFMLRPPASIRRRSIC